jgi:integrase
MSRLVLKYVQSFTKAGGGTYHYFRRAGQTRVRLSGLPGSAEFMQAYADALAAAPSPVGKDLRSKPGSLSLALADYYGSQSFRSLSGGTPQKRRAILEHFREQDGHRPLAGLPREFILGKVDALAPNAARSWLKAVRHFMGWAVARKLVKDDPTFGIRVTVPKTDGHHTWDEDEIARFEAVHPIGSKARLALALGLYTALRRSDVIRIGRQHIRDGILTARPKKTERTTGITLNIPIHSELAAIIDASPIGPFTLLVSPRGKSYSGDDFTDQFRRWCDAADLPPHCVFHGLRKAACRRLAEAGCTVHEIKAISGHKSLKEVERYTEGVDQAKLARAALERIGNTSVNSELAEVSTALKPLPKFAG